jgi:photoactive yellow protein
MASTIELPPPSETTPTPSALLFDQPNLLSALCAANASAYDQAGFGIVAMGLDSVVTSYNRWESQLSGLRPEDVVGRHFFTEVAPCTNNYMVALRYEQTDLDVAVDYVFSYRLRPVSVRLRLLKSTQQGRQFLAVERAIKL